MKTAKPKLLLFVTNIMMGGLTVILLGQKIVYSQPSSANATKQQIEEQQAKEDLAFSIGMQAYFYGFPLVFMERLKQVMLQSEKTQSARKINQFCHTLEPPTPKQGNIAGLTLPNSDTLYSLAWLDLTSEPLIFHVPTIQDRYYSFQMIDAYTKTFAYIGTRTTGNKTGNYAIVGPNWQKQLPSGVSIIHSPTNSVYLIGRTFFVDQADVAKVHVLQNQYLLRPLKEWRKSVQLQQSQNPSNPLIPCPLSSISPKGIANQILQEKSIDFFRLTNALLQKNSPKTANDNLLNVFKWVGINTKSNFVPIELEPATLSGLERSVQAAQKVLISNFSNSQINQNGWLVNFKLGTDDHDFILKAQLASRGLFPNVADEALYPYTNVDEKGESLSGANQYILHFDKKEIPPVKSFWSLAMYDVNNHLVENPINRYSINDHNKNLKYNADGSLDIYIQNQVPANKESNWLPAPQGNFYLILRMYIPKSEVLNGTYKVPGIKRVMETRKL